MSLLTGLAGFAVLAGAWATVLWLARRDGASAARGCGAGCAARTPSCPARARPHGDADATR